MRLAKYLLYEIFSKPVDYKIKENSEDKFVAEFTVDDYNFIFVGERIVGGKVGKIKKVKYGGEISFINTDYGTLGTQGIINKLGKGAIKVFSTVLDIIEKLIAEKNTRFLKLRVKVEEESRVKLYRKMLKRMEDRIENYTEKQQEDELVFSIQLKNED